MQSPARLALLALVTQAVTSNLPTLPLETVTAIPATLVGFTPKPTEVPFPGHELLLERQAYYSTCAYYSGQPLSCAPGYACATNIYQYAGCCQMNNVAACTIPISCVNYANYAASGYNLNLYGVNTWVCADMAMPFCFAKIWNYATRYTELGCNTLYGYVMLDPNPYIAAAGPVNAPSQPSESEDNPDPDTSGQTIDGDQNTQITGNNTTINYGNDGNDDDTGDGGGGSVVQVNVRLVLASVLLGIMLSL